MKYYIKITLNFLLLQLVVFAVIFAYLFFVNLLPVVSCSYDFSDLKEIGSMIFLPSFCVSFLNSALISLFLYGFMIVDHEHSCLFSVKIIPFFISLLFFILFFCLWHPNFENSSVHYKGNDARFFVDSGAFFQYYGEPKTQFSQDDFELLLSKVSKKDRELLLKSYSQDRANGDFILNEDMFSVDRFLLRKCLSLNNETENIKMFFGRVEKYYVYDAVISLPDKVLSFEKLAVAFNSYKEMELLVPSGDKVKTFAFEKKQNSLFSNSRYAFATALIYKNNEMILPFFNMYPLVSIGLWMVITLMILTVSGWIYIKEYPLISVIFNFLLLIAFYLCVPPILEWYHVVVKNFASESFVKLRYIIFFFISSGLLFVINISRWVSY
ncbi:MAG: hypothetical protein UHW86_11450, partial [Spirochaetota bacterium]|nr:hypothetical protein [Spirochaetota bacterium]